jgi:cytochrome P450
MIQVLTQVLCRLVSNPEYLEALRQEADAVLAEEGWTKAGIDKMRKLDSFVRETQRMDVLVVGLSGHSPYQPCH